MAPAAAAAAALMDELVEDILLRIPPDDPKSLLRAALVCRHWGRVASDPGFRRRFAESHGTPPPMLGFLCSSGGEAGLSFAPSTAFVPTTAFRPFPARLSYRTVDARHGRVLLHYASWSHERRVWDDSFVVWDPITGGERARLPLLPRSWGQGYDCPSGNWNAAVLCASAADAGACDHLDCRSGPFLVVFVAGGRRWGRSGLCALVYSSETAAWSRQIYAPHLDEHMQSVPSALAGNSLYLLCRKSVLKFDVATREMSLIDLPRQITYANPILRATADGGLELAHICSGGLKLWSREIGPDNDVVWASKVINLELLRAVVPYGPSRRVTCVTGSAHGLDVILVSTSVGVFTIHLNSARVTKVSEHSWLGGFTFPYMSFYTPGTRARDTQASCLSYFNMVYSVTSFMID